MAAHVNKDASSAAADAAVLVKKHSIGIPRGALVRMAEAMNRDEAFLQEALLAAASNPSRSSSSLGDAVSSSSAAAASPPPLSSLSPDLLDEFATLVARSAALPYEMPTFANRLNVICSNAGRGGGGSGGEEEVVDGASAAAAARVAGEIVEHARGTRPLLHAKVVPLLREFLALKRALGSPVEREVYGNGEGNSNGNGGGGGGMAVMDECGLVDRLISARPLAFLNRHDQFLLRSGRSGAGGELFDRIGRRDDPGTTATTTSDAEEEEEEEEPMTLRRLMSYDEMQIAALLAVSVPTHFINRGGRGNLGRPEATGEASDRGPPPSSALSPAPPPPPTHEARGVYVGQVGARFERAGRMEYELMVVDHRQNTRRRGYGAVRSTKKSLLVHHDHFGSDCAALSGVLCLLFLFIA